MVYKLKLEGELLRVVDKVGFVPTGNGNSCRRGSYYYLTKKELIYALNRKGEKGMGLKWVENEKVLALSNY